MARICRAGRAVWVGGVPTQLKEDACTLSCAMLISARITSSVPRETDIDEFIDG